ncbi:MAG: signal peptidase I [Candidatus Moraniibacteriota bacterium]|nr:MAG: signal peptidase I [Candidatus Moranbacteria bacterium]
MSEKISVSTASTPVEPDEEYLSTSALLLEMVKILVLAAVVIIPIRAFLFQPFFVQGSSMEPNFDDGEYLVISEFGLKHTKIPLVNIETNPFRDLSRQEPIVFRFPRDPSQFFIKRVIGLPGETVEIKNGRVYIYNHVHPDGYALDESAYLDAAVKTSDLGATKVADNEYFVMGDNRAFSYDSRVFGPIKKTAVIGRVLLRAWPVSELTLY